VYNQQLWGIASFYLFIIIGIKLEPWQTVVGLAAVEKHCPLVEVLNLCGCFRLNVSLNRNVSGLLNLIKLNLSGCNQVDAQALIEIANKCTRIEELNLSDCGKLSYMIVYDLWDYLFHIILTSIPIYR
jgi:hypothetical protein